MEAESSLREVSCDANTRILFLLPGFRERGDRETEASCSLEASAGLGLEPATERGRRRNSKGCCDDPSASSSKLPAGEALEGVVEEISFLVGIPVPDATKR